MVLVPQSVPGRRASPWPVEGKAERLVLTSDKHEGVRTDGTDDVMLQVGVQDAAGRDVSSNPTVTLTVVSGPGEFPTGRSITFSVDSDIRMADGKAAIEFRAYEAGTAVVEDPRRRIAADAY